MAYNLASMELALVVVEVLVSMRVFRAMILAPLWLAMALVSIRVDEAASVILAGGLTVVSVILDFKPVATIRLLVCLLSADVMVVLDLAATWKLANSCLLMFLVEFLSRLGTVLADHWPLFLVMTRLALLNQSVAHLVVSYHWIGQLALVEVTLVLY
jgi:hypothetical protein